MFQRPKFNCFASRYSSRMLTVVGLFVLIGCGVNAAPLTTTANAVTPNQSVKAISKVRMQTANKNKLESISGVSFDGKQIKASVISHGCTNATDFIIEHELVDNRCVLTIIRSKPDMCRRAPMLAEVSFDWSVPEDCTGSDIFVANPMLITNTPGSITKRSK